MTRVGAKNRKVVKIHKQLGKKFPKKLMPLIDSRIFHLFSKTREEQTTVSYDPLRDLSEDSFYGHHLIGARTCIHSSEKRFNQRANRNYLDEKLRFDPWVGAGNEKLSEMIEKYVFQNLEHFRSLDEIKIIDIGPGCGAITTLFALRALDRAGLIGKVKLFLMDPVASVLNQTLAGDFDLSIDAIRDFDLSFAGSNGEHYYELLRNAVPLSFDFHEYNPINGFDIVLAGYLIHHLNLIDKIEFAEKFGLILNPGGFVGLVDFYVENFAQYKAWLDRHLEHHPYFIPPIESPYFTADQISDLFSLRVFSKDDSLELSWALVLSKS